MSWKTAARRSVAQLRLVHPERAADGLGLVGDRARVVGRVLVLGLERGGERLGGAEVRALEPLVEGGGAHRGARSARRRSAAAARRPRRRRPASTSSMLIAPHSSPSMTSGTTSSERVSAVCWRRRVARLGVDVVAHHGRPRSHAAADQAGLPRLVPVLDPERDERVAAAGERSATCPSARRPTTAHMKKPNVSCSSSTTASWISCDVGHRRQAGAEPAGQRELAGALAQPRRRVVVAARPPGERGAGRRERQRGGCAARRGRGGTSTGSSSAPRTSPRRSARLPYSSARSACAIRSPAVMPGDHWATPAVAPGPPSPARSPSPRLIRSSARAAISRATVSSASAAISANSSPP